MDTETSSEISALPYEPGTQMDTETSQTMDISSNPDTETSQMIDISSNMDSVITSATVQQLHCLNCGTDISNRRRHSLVLAEVVAVLRQWIAPQVIQDDDIICHSCWRVALNMRHIQIEEEASTSSHRRHMCVSCGISLLRRRSHTLTTSSERETLIRNMIIEDIMPRQLRASDEICHPCWQRLDRQALPPPPPEPLPSVIYLPNLSRAAETQGHCFFPECGSTERYVVPKWLRVKLFTDYKFYVPQTCRICSFHMINDNWEILRTISQPIHRFTSNHIEDFATFVSERSLILDFTNMEEMSEELVRHWIGLTKEQFRQLFLTLSQLHSKPKGRLALAAYLMKLRTGDCDVRISSLLNVPRSTLSRLMGLARTALKEEFVPQNLGMTHIRREDISARNLLIPNGLFGGDNRQPIVIMDGTYLYVQKSSNYMYQKDTYSLHKYRNLMKPFVIVCTDGYIVDVLGPYPATTSDADILKKEFENESQPLRQYFEPGDVFILDRGFRDCVPVLEDLNYSVHMPATREEGEIQLSTLEANKSRTVTICRWVVEAVNGIFKMSYKLLRGEFFNRASRHAMTDFRIAGALINKFHQRITDRDDAEQILARINSKLFTNNDLSDLVAGSHMNRRRTQFVNINVNTHNVSFPRLEYSELILIACGTYQLKQARSYYGEHVRNDGSYIIEVCREGASNPLDELGNSNLLRARIKSRYISRKIYFVYVVYENADGIQSIKEYCCNCIVGKRTVGCCAHVMTVIWFLGWAKYQENINPPAQFLDNILINYESE